MKELERVKIILVESLLTPYSDKTKNLWQSQGNKCNISLEAS